MNRHLPGFPSPSRGLWLAIVCQALVATSGAAPLITGDGSSLAKLRSAIEAGDSKSIQEKDTIVKQADRAIRRGPLSVVDKTRTPASGDKRDYLSLGPYWWPDPSSEDGLPWIRKDGQINPLTRGEHVDFNRKDQLFASMRALSQAAYLTGEPKYGVAGVQFLERWFVDAETRMNPNLNHAQGIPGQNHGRPAGVIEWCGIDQLLSSIRILRELGYLNDDTNQALDKWFSDYADWLQTSEIGRAEQRAKNNHGTWYDVQLVGILLFLGREDEASQVIDVTSRKRIGSQIEPDGRQPHELSRTKSLSYSKMNLKAFMRLCAYGKRLGIDLENHETADGRSVRKAAEFLKPYTQGSKAWPYQQIK